MGGFTLQVAHSSVLRSYWLGACMGVARYPGLAPCIIHEGSTMDLSRPLFCLWKAISHQRWRGEASALCVRPPFGAGTE